MPRLSDYTNAHLIVDRKKVRTIEYWLRHLPQYPTNFRYLYLQQITAEYKYQCGPRRDIYFRVHISDGNSRHSAYDVQLYELDVIWLIQATGALSPIDTRLFVLLMCIQRRKICDGYLPTDVCLNILSFLK